VKPSRASFLIAMTIHTVVPLALGVILFLGNVLIKSAEMNSRPPGADAIIAEQNPSQRIILAAGMVVLVALIGLAGQAAPCLVTAVFLALLANALIPISRILYFAIATLIGTLSAALWFYSIGPGGLHVIAGVLTAFAAIGYLVSSLIVSRLSNV
jgi:hypothetical protein